MKNVINIRNDERLFRNVLAVFIATIVLWIASGASADDFTIDWSTIDGGGAQEMTGGIFSLSGTTGQPDAGPLMLDGDFELAGGFWAGATPFCYGDLNNDGYINLSDLAQLLGHYGMTGVSYWDGDMDGDGDVDLSDLAAMLGIYGHPCL